jgi:hypothetical protein
VWQNFNPNIPTPVRIKNEVVYDKTTQEIALSGDFYQLNYIKLIPIITAAAKELSTQVRELSTRIYSK